MKIERNGKTLTLIQGDITTQKVDAIVNAANSELHHGGGVAAAIDRAAGEEIQGESASHPYVPTGQVGVTTAGNLKAKVIIHAVGPVWRGGNYGEEDLLASAVENSITVADEQKMKSIAFPAISTDIFGYPLEEAAKIILMTILQTLNKTPSISEVRVVLFTKHDYAEFEKQLHQLLETQSE